MEGGGNKKPTYHQPNWQQCVTHSGGLPEWEGETGREIKERQTELVFKFGHFNVLTLLIHNL